jgi:hypothetical protein
MVKIFLLVSQDAGVSKFGIEISWRTHEIEKKIEKLWNDFRMKGIGEEGLSEIEMDELKELLEKKGDKGRLDAIDKAINNYKIRKERIIMERLNVNEENQNNELNVIDSDYILSKKGKRKYNVYIKQSLKI